MAEEILSENSNSAPPKLPCNVNAPTGMPLLGSHLIQLPLSAENPTTASSSSRPPPRPSSAGSQSQHSAVAKSAIMSHLANHNSNGVHNQIEKDGRNDTEEQKARNAANTLALPSKGEMPISALGAALTDTPVSTAPNSPKM